MNVTDRAYGAIQDIALRRGVDYPLVRVRLSYPQPGVRLIATEFVNDYNINTQCDVIDELADLSFVIDQASYGELEEATLDIGRNYQFFIKWKKESNHELHAASADKANGNRKKRKNRRSRRKGQNSGRGMCGFPIRYVVSGTDGDVRSGV